jgi:aminoglycoside phosphotransferase (APT) family kinase protein
VNVTSPRFWVPPQLLVNRAWLSVKPRRAWISAVVPDVAAACMPGAPRAGWKNDRVHFTGTLVVVAVVAHRATDRRLVVKFPRTPQAAAVLRRQADVLAALHADRRLQGWSPSPPRILGSGDLDGYPYWVEDALPGYQVTASRLRRTRRTTLLDAAVRVIEELHNRTTEPRLADRTVVEGWVDRPIRRLENFAVTRPRPERLLNALDRIRTELTASLGERVFRSSWIHGDFWPGNLLASNMAVTGVVDWDRADLGQLPLHDLLHLHVMSRRMTTHEELGGIVVHALRRGLHDAVGIPAGRITGWLDGLSERPAVLLYWLRHVSLFIDSEGHGDNPRWLRGNVEHVLTNA